jgi:hypothetical protein
VIMSSSAASSGSRTTLGSFLFGIEGVSGTLDKQAVKEAVSDTSIAPQRVYVEGVERSIAPCGVPRCLDRHFVNARWLKGGQGLGSDAT